MGWGHVAQSCACPDPQDCARGTANCVVFSCPLYSFDRAAVLHVWGRLWNSTFLEVRALLGPRAGRPPPQLPLRMPSPLFLLPVQVQHALKPRQAETPSVLGTFQSQCRELGEGGGREHLGAGSPSLLL